MSYLVFSNENNAAQAAKKIFWNAVHSLSRRQDGKVYVRANGHLRELDSMKPNDVENAKIFGYKNGRRNTESGYTEHMVTPVKAETENKWFFAKLSDLMDNVPKNYEEISDLPNAWVGRDVDSINLNDPIVLEEWLNIWNTV